MITHICEHCRRATPDLTHNRAVDEYWCNGCFDEQTDEAHLRPSITPSREGRDMTGPDGASPQDIEQAQADSLEAHSLKYHHCAQIFALASGKYALFGSYQIASGIDLLAIGTWDELRAHVDAYRVLADQIAATPRKVSVRPKAGSAAAADYADLFGDQD